jgi:hypothetical protein
MPHYIFQIPGKSPFQMICFYTASEDAKKVIAPRVGDAPPVNDADFELGWERLLYRFWQADKDYCDQRFKLIPNVVSASFLICV